MDYQELEQFQQELDSLLDNLLNTNRQAIKNLIKKIYINNPYINPREIAQKIVQQESLKSGALGALTGLGGILTLPLTIPVDFVKAFKIQSFAIQAIAYTYGYTPEKTDLKRDVLLIISHNSLEQIIHSLEYQIKEINQEESGEEAKKETHWQVGEKTGAKVARNASAKVGAKIGTNIAIKSGQKMIRDYTLRTTPKVFKDVIWHLSGRKIAQKAFQKSMSRGIPLVGAVIGGTLDWRTINEVGNIAIDYYDKNTPEYIDLLLRE